MAGRIAIRRTWALILGVLLVPSIPGQGLGSPYYQVTSLEDVYGGAYASWGYLNNVGQVAGSLMPRHGDHDHNWTYSYFYDSRPGGVTTVAGITLPVGGNQAGFEFGNQIYDFNDKGQALALVTNGTHTAFIDAKSGQETPVDMPEGYVPRFIDDAGRIYGDIATPGVSGSRPFIYENGETRVLDLPAGTTSVYIADVNNAGQVLAYESTAQTSKPSFLATARGPNWGISCRPGSTIVAMFSA